METEKNWSFIGDRRSPSSSDLAVFEGGSLWRKIRQTKIIPDGFYFVAGILPDKLKKKADLVPNIFVQGYRPHSSNGPFVCEKRSYGSIFVGIVPEELKHDDDLHLVEANVYKVVGSDCFELVLKNGEWQDMKTVEPFMARLRDEYDLLPTSDIKKFIYHCDKSRGYFLAGRDYEVWSQLVGVVETPHQLTKKVLIVDYNCGIPCIVDFNAENFNPQD